MHKLQLNPILLVELNEDDSIDRSIDRVKSAAMLDQILCNDESQLNRNGKVNRHNLLSTENAHARRRDWWCAVLLWSSNGILAMKQWQVLHILLDYASTQLQWKRLHFQYDRRTSRYALIEGKYHLLLVGLVDVPFSTGQHLHLIGFFSLAISIGYSIEESLHLTIRQIHKRIQQACAAITKAIRGKFSGWTTSSLFRKEWPVSFVVWWRHLTALQWHAHKFIWLKLKTIWKLFTDWWDTIYILSSYHLTFSFFSSSSCIRRYLMQSRQNSSDVALWWISCITSSTNVIPPVCLLIKRMAEVVGRLSQSKTITATFDRKPKDNLHVRIMPRKEKNKLLRMSLSYARSSFTQLHDN